jgi:hypothetical protein
MTPDTPLSGIVMPPVPFRYTVLLTTTMLRRKPRFL